MGTQVWTIADLRRAGLDNSLAEIDSGRCRVGSRRDSSGWRFGLASNWRMPITARTLETSPAKWLNYRDDLAIP